MGSIMSVPLPYLVVANWKSHKNATDAAAWIAGLLSKTQALSSAAQSAESVKVQVVIAPSVVLLPAVSAALKVDDPTLAATSVPDSNRAETESIFSYQLAVQDLSPFPAGAYTGAISTENLKGYSVKYAIMGHSERRRYFHETHLDVANKVDQALAADITPIVCVDEAYIWPQANAISQEQLARCVVAYEPLEAIGSGQEQPATEVTPVVAQVKEAFGPVSVIYGGSVVARNVRTYQGITQGVLVGSASLEVATFFDLLAQVAGG